MKLQYIGDSRDSFKWDYQDYLVSSLGYRTLNFVPMLTPDDGSGHGQTDPARFPAREDVVEFCRGLQQDRCLESVKRLPAVTGADYTVRIHRVDEHLDHNERQRYFSGIGLSEDQVIFVDPDNGFEPKNCSDKHVQFADIESILDQCTNDSVVSIFQYWRRRKFAQDFDEIRSQLESGYSAALFGRYVMFVSISRSSKTIETVAAINMAYSANKRTETIPW